MNDETDVTVHQLMNEVTECLQYSRALIGMLADLLEEASDVNCKDMALTLRAIEELTTIGYRRAARVHSQLVWDGAAESLP